MDEEDRGFFPNEITKEKQKTEEVEVSFPIDKSNTCTYCGSALLDLELVKVFLKNVCKQCRYTKLKFVTKTTASKEYLLNNNDFQDLKFISRPNPHKGTWHDMQLYLLDEITEIAIKKYGSLEKIEEIKDEREEAVKNRNIKNLKTKVRDLKRRTIVTDVRIQRHTHEFVGEGTTKRCVVCGLKVQQETL